MRSSVNAFCAIPRPTRREIAQFDDLAVPLLELVSAECLRFVAAALGDLPHAPPVLVRRLADLPAEVSAPVLVRSPVLTDIDLVALIGRHGLAHARAIAARPGLDERIAGLIRSIEALHDVAPDRAEQTRRSLRAMMRPAATAAEAPREDIDAAALWRKLRAAALAGALAPFYAVLADALGIDIFLARDIACADDVSGLVAALRALPLSQEQAFLVACCLHPARFARPGAAARFVEAFEQLSPADAASVVAHWRDAPARALRAS